jgi:NTP pyrophosphatase (non-canonical NTP hydrolase)
VNLEDYQVHSRVFDNHEPGLAPLVFGLVSEAGEIAGELEKAARHGSRPATDQQVRQRLLEEAGDVLWNLTRLVDTLGSSLAEIADDNLARLRIRYHERGIPLQVNDGPSAGRAQ